jgi:hypothetical protein
MGGLVWDSVFRRVKVSFIGASTDTRLSLRMTKSKAQCSTAKEEYT